MYHTLYMRCILTTCMHFCGVSGVVLSEGPRNSRGRVYSTEHLIGSFQLLTAFFFHPTMFKSLQLLAADYNFYFCVTAFYSIGV